MAGNNTIYKINVLNFEKHNPSLKSGHKKILISCGFLTDPKVRQLTPATKLLFLSCMLVAGDLTTSQYEVTHESLCYQSGVKSGSLQSQLDLLQSLQLLTYEKIEPLYNRIEKKVKEDKGKEKNPPKPKTESKNLPEIPAELSAPKANEFIALYCQAFKARHNAEPVIDGRSAGTAKAIVKTLPQDKWHLYLKAFFTMPDAYLFKAKHPLALFQTKLQEIAVFAQSGSFTTQRQASQIDNQSTIESQIKRIQEGKV